MSVSVLVLVAKVPFAEVTEWAVEDAPAYSIHRSESKYDTILLNVSLAWNTCYRMPRIKGTSRVLHTQFVRITQPQKHMGELGLGVIMGKESGDGRGVGVAVGVTLGGGVDMSGGRRRGPAAASGARVVKRCWWVGRVDQQVERANEVVCATYRRSRGQRQRTAAGHGYQVGSGMLHWKTCQLNILKGQCISRLAFSLVFVAPTASFSFLGSSSSIPGMVVVMRWRISPCMCTPSEPQTSMAGLFCCMEKVVSVEHQV